MLDVPSEKQDIDKANQEKKISEFEEEEIVDSESVNSINTNEI